MLFVVCRLKSLSLCPTTSAFNKCVIPASYLRDIVKSSTNLHHRHSLSPITCTKDHIATRKKAYTYNVARTLLLILHYLFGATGKQSCKRCQTCITYVIFLYSARKARKSSGWEQQFLRKIKNLRINKSKIINFF